MYVCCICFRSSFTVHEVLAILEDRDDVTSADVFITPPANHDVSDEDSGDEDGGGTINNLNGNQLNATSTATIVVGTEKIIVGDDNEQHSGSESEDDEAGADSDDNVSDNNTENDSAEIQVTNKRRRLAPDLPRNWTKKDLPIGTADKYPWSDVPTFLSQQHLSPTTLFELFFDEDVISVMCEFTTMYARQKENHQFDVSSEEMKAFLAILLISGEVCQVYLTR